MSINGSLKTYIEEGNIKNRGCHNFNFQIGKIKAFLGNKYEIVNNFSDADIVILLSCISVPRMMRDNYVYIDSYLKENKKIIYYGCMSKRIQEEIFDIYGDKITIIDFENEKKFNDIYIGTLNDFNKSIEVSSDKKNDYLTDKFLVIGKGCVHNCSYCVIREGKKIESYSIEKIMKILIKKINFGVKNFILAADDMGTYGVENNLDIFELINKILSYDESITLTLNPIYPKFLLDNKEKFFEIFETGRIDSIFCAVQHREPRILKLMNRGGYNHNDFEKLLYEIKEKYSKISFGTHLIYGFATETLDEFLSNFKNILLFDRITFFQFGRNYKMDKNIYKELPDKTIEKRKKMIREFLLKIKGITFKEHDNTFRVGNFD